MRKNLPRRSASRDSHVAVACGHNTLVYLSFEREKKKKRERERERGGERKRKTDNFAHSLILFKIDIITSEFYIPENSFWDRKKPLLFHGVAVFPYTLHERCYHDS